MDSSFEVIPLPHEYASKEDHAIICRKYRELRLMGLRINPEAFSSKYDDEVQFGPERWERRVGNPQVTTFLAVSTQKTSDPTQAACVEGKWLGMVVSVGLSPDGEPGGEKVAFDGMFVAPESRGTGVGMALVRTAMRWNTRGSRGKRTCEIRVGAANLAAVKLYRKCGFKVVGDPEIPAAADDGQTRTLAMTATVDLT